MTADEAMEVLRGNANRLPSGNHADKDFRPIDAPAVAQDKAVGVLAAELERLRRKRDEEVNMPEALTAASVRWLHAKGKAPDDVQWGRFPLGFVAENVLREVTPADLSAFRRAEAAERDLAVARGALESVRVQVGYATEGEPLELAPVRRIVRAVLGGEEPARTEQTCVESERCESEWHYWRCPKHHDYTPARTERERCLGEAKCPHSECRAAGCRIERGLPRG